MNHATGTYVNNGKDVIDVMTKGISPMTLHIH